MKSIDLDNLKQLQIEILQVIHDFCLKRNIKYSMSCGTLLGAVRHKGYIPWDDDIDIMLLRDEYEKLMKLFPKEYQNISIVSLEREDKWDMPYAKAYNTRTLLIENSSEKFRIGVNIDIYPYDATPDDAIEWVKFKKRRMIYQYIYSLKSIKLNLSRSLMKNLFLILAKMIFLPISRKNMAQFISKYAQQFNGKCTDYVYENVQGSSRSNRYRRSGFENMIDMPFEDRVFKGIIGYENYLSEGYGHDYMILPPVEKRIPHHSFKAYWKD